MALLLAVVVVVVLALSLEVTDEFWLRLESEVCPLEDMAGRKVMNTLGQFGELSWNLRSHSLWQRNLQERHFMPMIIFLLHTPQLATLNVFIQR